MVRDIAFYAIAFLTFLISCMEGLFGYGASLFMLILYCLYLLVNWRMERIIEALLQRSGALPFFSSSLHSTGGAGGKGEEVDIEQNSHNELMEKFRNLYVGKFPSSYHQKAFASSSAPLSSSGRDIGTGAGKRAGAAVGVGAAVGAGVGRTRGVSAPSGTSTISQQDDVAKRASLSSTAALVLVESAGTVVSGMKSYGGNTMMLRPYRCNRAANSSATSQIFDLTSDFDNLEEEPDEDSEGGRGSNWKDEDDESDRQTQQSSEGHNNNNMELNANSIGSLTDDRDRAFRLQRDTIGRPKTSAAPPLLPSTFSGVSDSKNMDLNQLTASSLGSTGTLILPFVNTGGAISSLASAPPFPTANVNSSRRTLVAPLTNVANDKTTGSLHRTDVQTRSPSGRNSVYRRGHQKSLLRRLGRMFLQIGILPMVRIFKWTIPDCEDARTRWPITLAISTVWLTFFDSLLLLWIDKAGCVLGIPMSMRYATFNSAALCTPALSVTWIVARDGFDNIATSSALGSNIFILLVGEALTGLIAAIRADHLHIERGWTKGAATIAIISILALASALFTGKRMFTPKTAKVYGAIYGSFCLLCLILSYA